MKKSLGPREFLGQIGSMGEIVWGWETLKKKS